MKHSILTIALCCLLLPQGLLAATSPTLVLTAGLGSQPGQFGTASGDSGLLAPDGPYADKDGRLVIADPVNRRVAIYNPDGTPAGVFGAPATVAATSRWPEELLVPAGGNRVVVRAEGKLFVHDYAGALLATIDGISPGDGYATDDGFIVYDLATDQYRQYSANGQLVASSGDIPPQLGVYRGNSPVQDGYRHSVSYPDRVYGFVLPQKSLLGFRLDALGDLYVTAAGDNGTVAYRVSRCGRVKGSATIPGSVKSGTGEALADYVARYGTPAIAPEGSFYVSLLSSEGFKVLRWTIPDSGSDTCQ